jgi:hypothetical protein
MEKIPTAEEFFEQYIQRGVNNTHTNYLNTAIEFAKMHVEAALKEATEKARIAAINYYDDDFDENNILNSYPLENIK